MIDSFDFSAKTSYKYVSEVDMEYHKAFIHAQKDYILDLLETRGYIYLNDIYELFGLSWPYKEKENQLFTSDDTFIISYGHAHGDDYFTITIYSQDDAESYIKALQEGRLKKGEWNELHEKIFRRTSRRDR